MGIEINTSPDSSLYYILTENCETFAEKYCHVTYAKGTFKRCDINEKENKIVFTSPWGFLMNSKKEILFSLDSGVYSFKEIPSLSIGFLPAIQDSDIYKKYS